MESKTRLAILGAGNIGSSIARGLVESGTFAVGNITLTRRKTHLLEALANQGFPSEEDNTKAVRNADIIIIAVEPQQIDALLEEIAPALDAKTHTVISVASDVSIQQIRKITGKIPVVRAMPNTAIAIRESMTCLAADDRGPADRKGVPDLQGYDERRLLTPL